MKKIKKYIFLLLLLVLTLFPLQTQANYTQPKFSVSNRVVRVGVFDSSGFWNLSGSTVMGGYAYDYLMAISNYTGWKYEFVSTTLSDAITMLQAGKIDVVMGLQQTPKRLEILSYPTNNIGTECGVVITSKTNTTFAYNEYEALDGKKIGCLKDNVYSYQHFPDYCKSKKINCDLIEYDTESDMMKALNSGKVDALLTVDISDFEDNKIVLKFHAAPIYCATSKGNTEIIEGIDYALDNIQLDLPSFGAETYAKYYGQQNTDLSLTRDELNYLALRTTPIKVALPENRHPYAYMDETKKWKGIIPDLFAAISAATNLNFSFVPASSSEQALRLLKNKEVEIVPDYWSCLALTSSYNASITSPYLENNLVTIFHQDSKKIYNNKPHTLAISMSLSSIRDCFIQDKNTDYSVFPTEEDCIEALLRGEVDGIVCDYFFAQELLSKTSYADYEFIHFNLLESNNSQKSMAVVSSNGTELFSIINKTLRSIKNTSLDKIISSNSILQAPKFSFTKWMQTNIFFILIAVAIILMILLTFILFIIKSRARISKILNTDTLTGGLSLNRFLTIASRLVQSSPSYVLIKTNIIHFRFINDLYGKDIGDQVLKMFSKTALSQLNPDECIARQEADHFLILLRKNTLADQRINRIFSKTSESVSEKYGFILKMNGGSYLIKKGDSIASSIEKTSHILADLSEEQSGFVQMYDDRKEKLVQSLSLIETDMDTAFKNNQFIPYFQPKYNIHTGKIVGAEALVRWMHPVQGLIPPIDFLPFLEKSGAIIELDFYMMNESCKFIKKHKEATGNWITISSNFSTKHFVHDNFCERVIEIANRYQIPHSYIELEITETLSIADAEIVQSIFQVLHENQFQIAIDDFGSGYSSLGILESLDIDILKLDRSFMQTNMQTHNINMIRGITDIAYNNGMQMICEGVETLEQIDVLKSTKCTTAQGYYYSKPLSEKDFIHALLHN